MLSFNNSLVRFKIRSFTPAFVATHSPAFMPPRRASGQLSRQELQDAVSQMVD